jgi:hypothetical protein
MGVLSERSKSLSVLKTMTRTFTGLKMLPKLPILLKGLQANELARPMSSWWNIAAKSVVLGHGVIPRQTRTLIELIVSIEPGML